MIQQNKMPDISNLEPGAVACFLAHSLAGLTQKKSRDVQAFAVLAARLIDKAKNEYGAARDAATAEENEGRLSFEEIMERNNGQYFFTCAIMNHLENCINAVSRIYKLFKLLPNRYASLSRNTVTKVRNAIEHMDEKVALGGSTSLNLSSDALAIEITGETLSTKELAGEILALHAEIIKVITR